MCTYTRNQNELWASIIEKAVCIFINILINNIINI